jgi:hypothetical protein
MTTRRSVSGAYLASLTRDEGAVWAMPTAPAGRAPHRAALHRLGHAATIGIAVFSIAYFAAQMLRAVV